MPQRRTITDVVASLEVCTFCARVVEGPKWVCVFKPPFGHVYICASCRKLAGPRELRYGLYQWAFWDKSILRLITDDQPRAKPTDLDVES